MTRKVNRLLIGAIALGSALTFSSPSGAQSAALIGHPINESPRITLVGNTRPEANSANDVGLVADNFSMPHMLLQLKRSNEQQQQLEQLAGQLSKPSSPNYRQFLTASQFAATYGPNPQDLQAITGWLQSHGFQVNTVYPTAIDFSGTAGQVREAFGTPIHRFNVNGESRIANMNDPQIPAALAPVVAGPVALNDFQPKKMVYSNGPNVTISPTEHDIVPGDLYTIYNFSRLFNRGITGKGQTIALMSESDLFNNSNADWNTFRSTFNLNGAPFQNAATLTTIHPGGCTHSVNGAEDEAAVDVEYSSAAAPDATILLASCDAGFPGGIALALIGTLQLGAPPDVISISYGACESQLGPTANKFFYNSYLQAVVEGISVFVSSGDSLGYVCNGNGASFSTLGISVNGLASTPWDVAVGGTDFEDSYLQQVANYWNPTNSATVNYLSYSSAKSYIPEIPWNSSCASALIANAFGYATTYGSSGFCNNAPGDTIFLHSFPGGSGGPSEVWGKPFYQDLVSIPGNPAVRVLPDVSLFSSGGVFGAINDPEGNGVWGHAYRLCYSGFTCNNNPTTWPEFDGTSFASPIWAGIQALINQRAGGRQGWVNPTYYLTAALQFQIKLPECNSSLSGGPVSTCIFHDVTQGDNDAPCEPTTPNCYAPSGPFGVLSTSTSSYQPAYKAVPGWDFATGLGTPNVTNLVLSWPELFF